MVIYKVKGNNNSFQQQQKKIEDLSIIQEGMLISFKLIVQNEEIRILGCYAPSSRDDPEFFQQCKEILDQSTETHGILLGDLNTTLDPILDRKNYKTDNHKKSRMVINNWIENNELPDFYRLTNGITQSWTYRVKESHEQTLKSRLDYVLGTSSLVYAISDIKHVLHE